ncbi:hypothetical protein BKA80DRAFT_119709 [Phyllosticta citrichinensis]
MIFSEDLLLSTSIPHGSTAPTTPFWQDTTRCACPCAWGPSYPTTWKTNEISSEVELDPNWVNKVCMQTRAGVAERAFSSSRLCAGTTRRRGWSGLPNARDSFYPSLAGREQGKDNGADTQSAKLIDREAKGVFNSGTGEDGRFPTYLFLHDHGSLFLNHPAR